MSGILQTSKEESEWLYIHLKTQAYLPDFFLSNILLFSSVYGRK